MKIAIIGTGMAGLACAGQLGQEMGQGADISLFDKSRGLSGRLSTRRATAHAFDHGAQYFRVKTAAFAAWLKPFEAAGHVRAWSPHHAMIAADGTLTFKADTDTKWVFAPGMSGIGKALVAGRPHWQLYLDTPITAIEGDAGAWHLAADEVRFGPFDAVVLAMPPVQARALLPDGAGFAAQLEQVKMRGCHTLMLGYEAGEAPPADWECAHFDDDMVGFAAINSSKPGRGGGFAVTVQTRHDWSQAHIEDDVAAVATAMTARFHKLTGWPVTASGHARLHRWRYASAETPLGQPFLLDRAKALAAIGDWCVGSKVEDAFTSGAALAAALANMRTRPDAQADG